MAIGDTTSDEARAAEAQAAWRTYTNQHHVAWKGSEQLFVEGFRRGRAERATLRAALRQAEAALERADAAMKVALPGGMLVKQDVRAALAAIRALLTEEGQP